MCVMVASVQAVSESRVEEEAGSREAGRLPVWQVGEVNQKKGVWCVR